MRNIIAKLYPTKEKEDDINERGATHEPVSGKREYICSAGKEECKSCSDKIRNDIITTFRRQGNAYRGTH